MVKAVISNLRYLLLESRSMQADERTAACKFLLFVILSQIIFWSQATLPCFSEESARTSQASACGKDPEKTLDPLSEPRIVMKHDALMYVLDETGMIPGGNNSAYGLYRDDTRTLSKLRYVINGQAPELLSKDIKGFSGTFVYGIRRQKKDADRSIVLRREVAMYQGVSERVTITNYSGNDIEVAAAICTGADFKDMFEVRGFQSDRKSVV